MLKHLILAAFYVVAASSPSISYSDDFVEEIQTSRGTLWRTTGSAPNLYYDSSACGHLSKYVISNVAQDIEAGILDAQQMKNDSYARKILNDECSYLINEEIYRTTGFDRNK